jgi:hypothetical protein
MTTDKKIFAEIDSILKRAEELEKNPPKKTISYAEFLAKRGIDIDKIIKETPC